MDTKQIRQEIALMLCRNPLWTLAVDGIANLLTVVAKQRLAADGGDDSNVSSWQDLMAQGESGQLTLPHPENIQLHCTTFWTLVENRLFIDSLLKSDEAVDRVMETFQAWVGGLLSQSTESGRKIIDESVRLVIDSGGAFGHNDCLVPLAYKGVAITVPKEDIHANTVKA